MRNGRALLAAAVAAAVLMATSAALLVEQEPADASALSRTSRGWLIARRYLEERGCRVTLLDRDQGGTEPGVLVVAFPWQRFAFDPPSSAIDGHLQRGGTVLFAYSGWRYDGSQIAAAHALGLHWDEISERAPLDPFQWRKHATRSWSLSPEPSPTAGLRPVRIDVPERVPRAPKDASVFVRGPAGSPVAFAFPRGRGRVIVVPADAFSNARIGQPGNADLLEMLRQHLGDAWAFDEYHHGLSAPAAEGETGPQRVLLLYLLQLAFVYVLVVLAVARRFGPSWREPITASGSTVSFLLGLGALHHRLGHHRAAARLLLSRARELDPRLPLMDPTEADGPDLLGLARRVGEAQSGRGKNA
jgi:hypothetical protein